MLQSSKGVTGEEDTLESMVERILFTLRTKCRRGGTWVVSQKLHT